MKYIRNILASVITNFETVEDVIKTSTNSAGSAMAENDKWLDSIEGKTYQFTNALETMWSNMLDSEVVKTFIDFGTKLIQILDTTPGKVTALAVALGALKKFKNLDVLGTIGSKMGQSFAEQITQTTEATYAAAAASEANAAAKTQEAAATATAAAADATESAASTANATANTAQAAASETVQQEKTQEAISVNSAAAADQGETTTSTANAAANVAQAAGSSGVASGFSSVVGMASKAGTAIKAFGLAAGKAALIIAAVSVAVKALGAAWEWLDKEVIHRAENIKQKTEELTSAFEDTKKTLDDNLKTLSTSSDTELYSTLEDEFARLTKGVDRYGNNISLTTDQYERYKEICEKIVGINPSIAQGYDNATKAIGNNANALSQLIELQKIQARQNASEYTKDDNLKTIAEDAINSYNTAKTTYNNELNEGINYANESAKIAKKIQDSIVKSRAQNSHLTGSVSAVDEYDVFSILGYNDLWLEDGFDDDPRDVIDTYYNDILTKLKEAAAQGGSILHEYAGSGEIIEISADDVASIAFELEEYVKAHEDALKYAEKQVEEAQDGFISALLQVPASMSEYDNLSDANKSWVTEWIKNSEMFKIDDETTQEDILEAKAEIRKFMTDIADEKYYTTTDSGAKITASDVLDSIFNLDTSDVSWEKYQNDFQTLLWKLWDAIGGKDNTLGFETATDLALSLGFDMVEQSDNQSQMYKRYAEIKDITTNEAREYFESLPAETVQRLLQVDWNLVDENNVDDVINPDIASNMVITQSYSSLVESVTAYNEVLAQTQDILYDGIEVTQEYKDALTELGLSEEQLNECFDETNPLVVKNADALNNLLKDTKQVTAQNVKLAKSQVTLKYYEKYKELKQLTNGRKVETSATLNQVKAIYKEMSALQKSISRYSMLEHQLLGATNAYEEFEKAQEMDAANDYETKAEDLVGYLVDAFQTAKLGTESAQAAIKGLVPESVYEDLDTLDEKMSAVYDYFTTDLSKYFYVKFNDDGSLESAEMLVDNVKQFVEDGIANGVFTGSWKEWDLDSSISTLDDLTKKMGVTKEVAYAFLQAMETYDISWIGGDASTLLDKLVPTTSQIKTVKEQIQTAFNQTPIELTTRLNVTSEQLAEQGHVNYSSTFDSSEFGLYNEDGSSYQILATPVLPNGDILGPDEMADYINQQLASGKSIEEVDIFVGSYKIAEEAEEAKQLLDESIKHYQNLIDNYSLENAISTNIQKQAELEYKIGTGQIDADTVVSADGVTTAAEQLSQLRAEAEANSQAAREHATAWTETKTAYDDAAEAVEDCNEELAKAKQLNDPDQIKTATDNLEKAEGKLWDTYSALCELGEPTEIVLSVALEQVEKDLATVKATMNETELDIVSQLNISNLQKDESGNWIVNLDAYSNLDEASKEKVQQYLDYLEEQHNINILQGEGAVTTLDVLSEIKDILSQTYELMVETDDAETKAKSFADIWNTIKDKTVTLTQNIKEGIVSFFTRTPNEDDGVSVNGTAHVRGNAFAGGSWGAPKTETSLVGELGPEILVRGNRWTTVGENGAEFTQVKKGDIIFNHKQSEQLLKNGHVTGRGKAYAGGTAYAGVHPYLGGLGNIDDDWQNITPTLWNTATNDVYLDDSAKNEFEETLDWIAIRMEELAEKLELYNAKLENATGYADKNGIIDTMIEINEAIRDNAIAGAQYYEQHAEQYLAGMSDELIKAAKNGAIAITEFTKENDEATVKAIQNYREYSQMAADLYQQAETTLTEIRNLAIQQIDNAQRSGEVRATVEASQTEKLQNAVDFDEARGMITDPQYYAAMMENAERTMAYLTDARDNMQREFNDAVADGQLKVGSDEWYENLDKLYQMDAQIDEARNSLEDFQNSINDIYWESFDQLISQFENLSDEAQGLVDILSSEDMFTEPDYEKGWDERDVQWTKEGLATLGLHAQEMERAEAKAQAYGTAIDDLTKEYQAGHYSESEYNEKLAELTKGQIDAIKAAKSEKDAIVDLNKSRVDAIKNGINKQIEAYEELIEKKKESLDAEKDIYDFQKAVQEHQKDISAIERKIAALSSDNSASAIAQRKKLEAELAEVKAALQETYYERSIENQQTALDNELETFQEAKEKEIEAWDKYLEDVETVVAESLGIVKENAVQIGSTLATTANEYNLTISEAILDPWKDGHDAIATYTKKFGDSVSTTTTALETVKNKWTEVKNSIALANAEADKYYNKTAATAKGQSVSSINAENAAYYTGQGVSNGTTNKSSNSSTSNTSTNKTSSTPAIGSTVTVSSSATKFGSKSGSAAMASFVRGGSYTVYQVADGQVLIGRNGSYTGWVNLRDLQGYAKGTKGVKKNELAWIDENGLEELVMHAGPDGRLQYLSKGTPVLNSDLTNRIMDLAMNPQEVLDRNRPQISLHPEIHNTEINLSVTYGDMVSIGEYNGGDIKDLEKMVSKQFEKHTKDLNNALKRYTRG